MKIETTAALVAAEKGFEDIFLLFALDQPEDDQTDPQVFSVPLPRTDTLDFEYHSAIKWKVTIEPYWEDELYERRSQAKVA